VLFWIVPAAFMTPMQLVLVPQFVTLARLCWAARSRR
jgi:hypothetical protein